MSLEKTYQPELCEESLYKMWEEGGYFTPRIDASKKPYSIILPLPNFSDPMHIGHALFTIQDILIRYHRMLGDATLWLPGGDHAGIETQFVYEKYLAKTGKSRFDFDRKTLYQMIADFVAKNGDVNKSQMKRLGFSLDWTRFHYSLEPAIVEKVNETFRQLYRDGLIYRGERLVNYCTKCGTSFSDLEVDHVEREDRLYYMKYGPFTLATTRPETKFGDTAIAVNPQDKRYKDWIGKEFTYDSLIGERKMLVVGDAVVDMKFGTGVVKVTPAHDHNDFEIAQRHNLSFIKVIDRNGKLTEVAGRFAGLSVKKAREQVVEELKQKGEIIKVDEKYKHVISVCYRCGTTIEPMLSPQWYVKTKPLAVKVILAIKTGKTKIVPKKRFEKMFLDWMENIMDWNISRQIVWGPQISAWYCLDCSPNIYITLISPKGERISGTFKDLKKQYSLDVIKNGIQSLISPVNSTYQLSDGVCEHCGGTNLLQETDTFDTWFLSGQWPLSTLGFPDSSDFKYFYPTSVLDTLWDILLFWVARMMMLGIYKAHEVPFKVVHIHARVVDKMGRKMSKSKGNTIDPMGLVKKYGADALRVSLVFGVAPASDVVVSDDKVRAMRNFANKVWNIGRFLEYSFEQYGKSVPFYSEKVITKLKPSDLKLLKQLKLLIVGVTKGLDTYQFSRATESLYEFVWHELADNYVEEVKKREAREDKETALMVLRHVYLTCLKLLHPFMPYVTEELWSKLEKLRKYNEPLIISNWPKSH